MKENKNRLIGEKSPYLLQHADNPVNWYPWSKEALKLAAEEKKPIFLSIGYSTCHWCHVMQKESFADQSIANILNDNFISIKVDREELPDIDKKYMNAVIALTGEGGWPLNVFLTPELKPFFGGTYFPPNDRWGRVGFKKALLAVKRAWQENKDELMQSAESITSLMQSGVQKQKSVQQLDEGVFSRAYEFLAGSFDERFGGFGPSPKFPNALGLSFLFHYFYRTLQKRSLEMAEKTLLSMAKGGIYDHLSGGFHRYAANGKWILPHFEKMLYDQALIARAYLEAYQITKKEEYKQVALGICEYVLKDLTSNDGAFYSAQDADSADPYEPSVKREGAFYLWQLSEVAEIVGQDDLPVVKAYFGIKEQGNIETDINDEFKGKNILYQALSLEETARESSKSPQEISGIIDRAREKLLKARNKRPRPHLDDKILVDWNGLMIATLSYAGMVLDEPRFISSAEKAASFILNSMRDRSGRLLHRFRDKEAGISATLDDYAFFIYGLLELYEGNFKPEFLKQAELLTKEMISLFWDSKGSGGFFFTPEYEQQLLYRQKDIYDGALPSGNSMAALVLIRQSRISGHKDFEDRAQKLFDNFSQNIMRLPSGHAQALIALDHLLSHSATIIIVHKGREAESNKILRYLREEFLPHVEVISTDDPSEYHDLLPQVSRLKSEQKINIYVCTDYGCMLPAKDLRELKAKLFSAEHVDETR